MSIRSALPWRDDPGTNGVCRMSPRNWIQPGPPAVTGAMSSRGGFCVNLTQSYIPETPSIRVDRLIFTLEPFGK